MVNSAQNLPHLNIDPICQVSFSDPTSGCLYICDSSQSGNDLNPEWNQTHSWPLFFKPIDKDLIIHFKIYCIDSLNHNKQIGNVHLKLSEIGTHILLYIV